MRGVAGPVAMQYFYSLVSRDIEDEHVPLATKLGMGVVPWSPLAYGLLTGKYDRVPIEAAPDVQLACHATPQTRMRDALATTSG